MRLTPAWCASCLVLALIISLPGPVHAVGHPFWQRGDKADAAALDVRGLLGKQAPLLDDGSRSLQAERLAGRAAPATVRGIALMVAFSDTTFYGHPDDDDGELPSSGQSEFLYSAHDSVFYDHLLQDVADYYTAVSGGRFTFEYEVHDEVIRLTEPMAFYGNHPEEGEQPIVLTADAIAAVDDRVDFSSYDTILLIHAGAGEETDANNDSPEQIYSSYIGHDDLTAAVEDSVLAEPYFATDDHGPGDGIRHVLILPECEYQDPGVSGSGYFGSLGVYCFELGLRLGMLSLFDFVGGDSQGIGQLGLMGFGLWSAGGLVPPQPCAFNKQLMGWLEPYRVDPWLGDTWTLDPAADVAGPRAAARIDLSGAEYFLIEYRQQDPDGNNDFTFTGDLNGNTAPDFFDASNPDGSGLPIGYFDPAEDTDERYTGSEWDFFLTANAARPAGVQAAGTGLSIWHIDEGVVRAVWDAERNLFNGDASRKSVDLEEADGIQDLDTRQGGVYWLGADVDTWKAEGNDSFGPRTRPDTRTNAGLETGLVIDGISAVVVDSAHVFDAGLPTEYTGILYHDQMTFAVGFAADSSPAAAARDLVGVDAGVGPLVAARLHPADTAPTVIMAADSGRVYAWTSELAEAVDHDGDPETIAPLCVGTDTGGEPIAWLGQAVIGDIAGDDALEIVLAAADGLYAFDAAGDPVVAGPASGRLTAPGGEGVFTTTPVLMPPDGEAESPGRVVAVGHRPAGVDGAPTSLYFYDGDGQEVWPPVTLDGVMPAAPVRADGSLWAGVVLPDGAGRLQRIDWSSDSAPRIVWSEDLPITPGARPLTVAGGTVMVTDDGGRVHAWSPPHRIAWPEDLTVSAPIGAGGAILADDRFGRIAETGAWQTGWPLVPRVPMTTGGAEPLMLGDADDPFAFLFATRDGRLALTDPSGGMREGWPIAGPADMVTAPVVLHTPGPVAHTLTLVAAGVTPEVAGVDPQTDAMILRPVTRLRAWTLDLGAAAVPTGGVAMAGGSAEGRIAIDPLVAVSELSAATSLADSHICYPQPLRGESLRVRAMVTTAGEARAMILNLQGEIVRDTGTVPVPGGGPYEFQIDMNGVASGLYICRLQVGDQTSVKTVAVAR